MRMGKYFYHWDINGMGVCCLKPGPWPFLILMMHGLAGLSVVLTLQASLQWLIVLLHVSFETRGVEVRGPFYL